MSNADKGAVGLIPALELASLTRSLRKEEYRGETQVAERNDNKSFINPLKIDLTVIGFLRRAPISCHDTTALT